MNFCFTHNSASKSSDLEAAIPLETSHHPSVIHYHKSTKIIPSMDLVGADLKTNNVVNLAIDPNDHFKLLLSVHVSNRGQLKVGYQGKVYPLMNSDAGSRGFLALDKRTLGLMDYSSASLLFPCVLSPHSPKRVVAIADITCRMKISRV